MFLQGLEELLLSEILKYRITRGSYKISHDKSHEIKNVTDFNVVDSVRRDIKVLVTKTRYTVCGACNESCIISCAGEVEPCKAKSSLR